MIGLVGLGLGLTMGKRLGLKLTIGTMLGLNVTMGLLLGLIEAPELGLADAVAVVVPVEGVGVLPVPVLPDGELLAWAVPVTVPSIVAEGISDAVAASVGCTLFWAGAVASAVACGVAVGFVFASDMKGSFRSVHPDIVRTASNITDINAIDLFDNTKIMHL